jgi:hypothetical protein
MLDLINPKLWFAAAIAAALAGALWFGHANGSASVQAKWDKVELDRAEQSAKLVADAQQVTKDLQVRTNTTTKAKDAQIAKLNHSLGVALDGLRNRPARPAASDLPGDTAAGPASGCTGAQLYRSDATAFVREAARADRLLADLQQCQAQYNAAYNALNQEPVK